MKKFTPRDEHGRDRRTINPRGAPITIVNEREKIGRNKRIGLSLDELTVVLKMKRHPAYRLPIPSHEVYHGAV